jgi:hypothetical protein
MASHPSTTRALAESAPSRLLRGDLFPHPPRDWRRWTEPSPAFPIDEEVTALRKRERPPKLRDKRHMGVPCPYWYARFMVAGAADMAEREAAEPAASRRRAADQWASLAKESASLAKQLSRRFGASPPWGRVVFFNERFPSEAPASITQAYENIARAVLALLEIEQYARSRRRLLINTQGNIWRLTFAAALGLAWRALTGMNPANSTPFVDFVSAAWNSLSDDPEPVAWERHVRRAIRDYAGWDRYDREVIDQLPIAPSKVWALLGGGKA